MTIVTQCSLDRLPQLRAMALGWDGVLSVAVHVPYVGGDAALAAAHATLQAVHDTVESSAACGCRLDVSLVQETVRVVTRVQHAVDVLCLTSVPALPMTPHQTTEAWWGRDLYPVNALRNVALKAATTDLVLLLDIDFVPNAGLHAPLEAMQQDMLSKPWTATVLPAFEVRQV